MTPPTLIIPRFSSSNVVAADFHPDSPNLFILAFADGTAALFDASRIWSGAEVQSEIGYIKKLHAVGSKTSRQVLFHGESQNQLEQDIVNEVSTITAVGLVPGHKALAVTVGADGKCCVVDFTQPTKTRALLLRSWHIRRPATSLSIVYYGKKSAGEQADGSSEDSPNQDYCIAIGRQDGKVLLFDLGGQAIGKKTLDPSNCRVVDVEWAKEETHSAFTQNEQHGLSSHEIDQSRELNDHLDSNFSNLQPTVSSEIEPPLPRRAPPPPPLPPRPSPRPGGKLEMKRAQTTKEPKSPVLQLDSSMAVFRAASMRQSPSPQRLEDDVWRADPVRPIGSRDAPNRLSWKRRARSPNRVEAAPELAASPTETESTVITDSHSSGLRSRYVDEAADKTKVSANSPRYSPTPSPWSYKTAVSHLYASSVSEASNDTVIDWSTAASSRRPESSPVSVEVPMKSDQSYFLERPQEKTPQMISVQDPQQYQSDITEKRLSTKKKKGHESLSIITPNYSTLSVSTAMPGSFDSPPLSSRSECESEATVLQKADAHAGDKIVQWPAFPLTFRKSPRVPDLSVGVESATAEVLEAGQYAEHRDDDDTHPHAATDAVSIDYSGTATPLAKVIPPISTQDVLVEHSDHRQNIDDDERDQRDQKYFDQLRETLNEKLEDIRIEIRSDLVTQREWVAKMIEEAVAAGFARGAEHQ